MITLTPAPAIDWTYEVPRLTPGEVHRAIAVHSELAGKGVNVSRGLALAGISSFAVLPLGASDIATYSNDPFLRPVVTGFPVRVNITVVEEAGRTTKVNERPPALSPEQWDGLVENTLRLAEETRAEWILLAGTIPLDPQGLPLDLSRLFERAALVGAGVGLDTSGPPLIASARSGHPDFIKPNAPELAECVGRSLHTLGDVIDAAQEVHRWGVSHVLVSLGPDGMVGVSGSTLVHASTRPVDVRNTIGAGDASVAGFLAHQLTSPGDVQGAVANAVAWGTKKVQEVSSQLSTLESLPAVDVTASPDRSMVLTEPGIFTNL